MDTIWTDFRDALSVLRRNAAFTLAVVATLAVGIAANTTIFSVVRGVLLKPLPYERAEDLAMIWADLGDGAQSLPAVSPLDYRDYPEMSRLFEEFAAASGGGIAGFAGSLTGGDREAELIDLSGVSANFFPLLGIEPQIGRVFTADEDHVNGARVAMVSHGLWQRRYGAAPLVGKTIELDGIDHEVVGIMPAGFRLLLPKEAFLLKHSDVWVPLRYDYEQARPRNWTLYSVFGRKHADATWAEVQADMDVVAAELRARHAEHESANLRIRAVPLQHDVTKSVRPAILALSGAVAFLLLIVCANVASMMLVRGGARRRELAIQAAFGAPRHRIVRRLLIESLLLAGLAAALALALSRGALTVLAFIQPAGLPRLAEISLDPTVLAFTGGVTLLVAVAFGLVPALVGGRVDLVTALGSVRMSGSRQTHHLRRIFVVAELALALVLLVGLGLMLRSFAAVVDAHPGFESAGVLTFTTEPPRQQYAESESRRVLYQRIEEEILAIPGARSVAAIRKLPLTGSGALQPYAYDERTARNWESVTAESRPMTPGYLDVMETRLLAGRDFTRSDVQPDAARVIIVDETLAEELWGVENAVGQTLQIQPTGAENPFAEVVGVMEHVRMLDLARPGREIIARPMGSWWRRDWVVKTDGDPRAIASEVRAAVARVDPDLPVASLRPMVDYVDDAADPARFSLLLMSIFGGVAVVLAALGIASVIALDVIERRRELAIRLALGEHPSALVRSFVREGARLALISAGVGLVAVLLFGRLINGVLVGVEPTDPSILAPTVGFMIASALFACYLPARRAARIDPSKMLRAE